MPVALLLAVLGMLMASLRADGFWYTAEQRGYRAYLHGDYADAAENFQSPAWQASACYRLADYPCAAQAFAVGTDAVADYNLGNTLARSGDFNAALERYQSALQQQPGWQVALDNQRLVAGLIDQKRDYSDFAPDADKQDDGSPKENAADQRERQGGVSIEQLDPKSLDELWLRGVSTGPAAFLQLRFASEANQPADAGASGVTKE